MNPNNIIKNLYHPIIKRGGKYFNTSRRAAELIKYASNAFLATKISYINEISNLCEKVDVVVEDIAIGMGLDQRIGSRFLRVGPGYGGSCFPKDTKALLDTAKKFKTNLSIIETTVRSNEKRHHILLNKIKKIMKGKIFRKKITFLGVTFKANTDDMRESPSLKLIPQLHKKGAIISYYDPSGFKNDFKKFKNVNILKGWIPEIFNSLDKKNKYKFVHLDVDLYQPTLDSLKYIFDKVIDGGIILTDDFSSPYFPGNKKAWQEFFLSKNIKNYTILPTGQSVYIKES